MLFCALLCVSVIDKVGNSTTYMNTTLNLKELKRPLPRITVLCIGNEDCTKGKYAELAMASGGGSFNEPRAFAEHMLLTHSERLAKAAAQKKRYAQLTPPEDRFDWFVPAVVKSKGNAASGSLECKDVGGAKLCSKRT